MQSHFIAAINQLVAEKNLPKHVVMETIEAALKAAYKKDYGNKEQELEVVLSDSGDNATIFLLKEVVEEVEDPDFEMSLDEAKKYKKTPEIGDTIKIDVTPLEYGRIAAQAAKQVIIQRLQEAERTIMYDEFKDRENELLNAQIHRVQNEHVYVDLGKIIVELPKDHQIPSERYYAGQRIKLYLDKVIKTTKGPRLLISRTHPSLVRKLMELEIPEIGEGVVELKSVARDPGVRCKIAVISNDEKIDPIGSCVGQKGVRIQSIMDELNGERIDVIKWDANPVNFLKLALAPAKVSFIDLDEEGKRAKVYVEEDQRPLAIGKRGQNVRLASKLLEYEVDILDVDDLSEEDKKKMVSAGMMVEVDQEEATKKEQEIEVTVLDIDQAYIDALLAANLTQVTQLKGLSATDIATIEGLNEEAGEAIHQAVKNFK